ncbi:MAG: cytochrome c [Gammaproteobacteria bacterium]|jgi:cbb3-type cytochrome oxidase cytochrome c subunit
MRKGEKGILAVMGLAVVIAALYKGYTASSVIEEDKGIPYYTTASDELKKEARTLFTRYQCHDCHSLWTKRSIMQSVPAPPLDGMGSLKDEEWFFNYFSAENPQSIVPTRLKEEFQMPSLAHLTLEERHTLAKYMASLKVEDWYLEETKKRAYEKLTGKEYKP